MAEIFETHEELGLDAERRARTFARWAGASVLAHALLLAALVYVPVLRDTFSIANELSGFRVVSRDYNRVKEYQRAVVINLAAQKLYYPAGYFEVASQQAAPAPPNDVKFIGTVAPTPEPTPRPVRVKPAPTPSPSPAAAEQSAKNDGDKGAKPAASPSPSPAQPQTAEEAERRAKESGVEPFPKEINVAPFEDLIAKGKKLKDAGQINLSDTLEVTVTADRKDDGTLTNVNYDGLDKDPKLSELSQDFVNALSESRLLAALKGTQHLVLKVRLDDKLLAVRLTSEMASTEEAQQKSNGYNMLLLMGAMDKKGKDEEKIFKSIKVNYEASQIVLTFNMPRADASALATKLAAKNQTAPSPTPGD